MITRPGMPPNSMRPMGGVMSPNYQQSPAPPPGGVPSPTQPGGIGQLRRPSGSGPASGTS